MMRLRVSIFVSVLYHFPNTTWMPPCSLLCDVICAPPECNTTSESLQDVIESNSRQGLRNLLIGQNSVNGGYYVISEIREFGHTEAYIFYVGGYRLT